MRHRGRSPLQRQTIVAEHTAAPQSLSRWMVFCWSLMLRVRWSKGCRTWARGTDAVQLLTRTGLDWTRKYPAIAAGVASLGAWQAHLDGELCGFLPDGITSSGLIQTVSDAIDPAGLEYFIFELLHLDGEDLCPRPLIERKARPAPLLPRCRTAPCRERRWPRLGRSLTRFLAVFGLAGLRHCDRNRLLAAFHLPARPLRRVHKNCFFCGVPMVRIHLPPAVSPVRT
jgi:hypothetical protein